MTKKLSDTEKNSKVLANGAKYLEMAVVYANSKNGQVLTKQIQFKKDFISWQCAQGHVWSQPLSAVLNNRSWCSVCSGNFPRNLQVLIDIANSRGGKLLSTEYRNVDSTYEFECSIGHKFSNTFKHVEKGGQWCPTCNKGSKSEEICRTIFEQIFGYEFKKIRPKWLKNSRNRQMEIDGFCEELGIGFEYQGIQHFGKQIFNTSLEQRIADDKLKAKLCAENGVHLFIITYQMEYSDFPINIERQARNFGLNLDKFDFKKPIEIERAYIRNDRLPELIELMKAKKITVLSNKWIGVATAYKFQCDVCGHRWQAQGNRFFNSRRVGGCQKCAIKIVAGSNRLDIQELHNFAKQHGGKCLSTSYVEIKQNYKFECSEGHIFEDIFNNMKSRNTFCPTCEGRTQKKYLSDSEALSLMSQFQLQPISPRPKLSSQGWLSSCLVCKEEVSPSIQTLLRRGVACKYCSGFAVPERKVRKLLASVNLVPIEPFQSASTPWKSRCLICESIVKARYSNLSRGQRGCRECYYSEKRSVDKS